MKRLEDYGEECQKLCIALHTQGMSLNAISDELNLKFNADLTRKQIEKFLERSRKKIGQEIVKQKDSFNLKLTQQAFDTLAQLKDLNSSMWELFYELKENPEQSSKKIICPKCNKNISIHVNSYESLTKIASHLLSEIEHQDKLLGKLKQSSLNITYNYVDLSKKLSIFIPKLLKQYEEKGVIKIINKRKFKEYIGKEIEEKEEEIEEI